MIEHMFDTVWSEVDEIALTAIEYAIDEDLAHFDNQTLLAE